MSLRAIARAEPRCRSATLSPMASRMLVFRSRRARRSPGVARVAAEHPLEHDARVDLHRQRLRGVDASEIVLVYEQQEIAGAAPEMARMILGRQLDRRERRSLPDVLRDHLIDGRVQPDDGCPSAGTFRSATSPC